MKPSEKAVPFCARLAPVFPEEPEEPEEERQKWIATGKLMNMLN